MTKNALIERAAVRLAGAALLLGGLAFNPLALAHFFSQRIRLVLRASSSFRSPCSLAVAGSFGAVLGCR